MKVTTWSAFVKAIWRSSDFDIPASQQSDQLALRKPTFDNDWFRPINSGAAGELSSDALTLTNSPMRERIFEILGLTGMSH
jgi:hypothetical protein